MKIGMMTDTYKPHVSGITNYIALNKKFIEAQGHEVYIFTFGDETIIDEEKNVIRSPGVPLIDTGYYLSLRYHREARILLQSMDIVHVHHPFLSGTLALRYCRPSNIPIVFTNHTRYDLYTHAYFPILPEGFGETAMKAYLPSFCRSCNLVIAPSKGIADVLQRLGVDTPIEIVPNGVDLEPFQHKSEAIHRNQLSINEDAILLVYIGRLGPEKNLPFLIRAFGGICEAFNNVHLMLVGDGSEKENLQSLIEHMRLTDRVHFIGMVSYQQIPQYLAMADIFATASITEVHPLSVIEAMATGLPVLGIDSPGVGDTIENGITGYLSSNNLASFTAKMVLLITEQDKRIEMGHQARQRSENYSIRHTTQIMLKHYDNLLNSSSNHRRGLSNMVKRFIKRLT
jgi:1,2-diacylglycerol 3-alpha-glucosyltransferase